MSLLQSLLAIEWNVHPEIFQIGSFAVRWYGLLFASGFLVGYYLMERMFRNEQVPLPYLDRLTWYIAIATLIGARLGHVFFYEPKEYLAHPIDILKVWEGGLASHGAAIGILIALLLYIRKTPQLNFLWTVDRLVIVVMLGGAFIRIGNLMNSEIVGHASTMPWAFHFVNAEPKYADVPRHPAQLYEALFYFFTFFILMRYYWRNKGITRPGWLFGVFLVLCFGFRIVVEFWKEPQVDFETQLPLDMGQLLSIPLVAVGLYYLLRKPSEQQVANYAPKVLVVPGTEEGTEEIKKE